MWKIIEQVRVNGHLEKKYTIVDCTQEELDNKIIPILSKLIKVKNKHHSQLYAEHSISFSKNNNAYQLRSIFIAERSGTD